MSPLLLAATSLAFDHPTTGERMKFEAPPPKEILALFPDASKGQGSATEDAEDTEN